MMIAALILLISLATLLLFSIQFCRSIIASSSKAELSEQVRQVAGLEDRHIPGDDFGRLLEIVFLCPDPGDDGLAIRAVRSYYRFVGLLRAAFQPLVPAVGVWSSRERDRCAYFAAVTLDRRIAYNRELMTRETAHHL